jgi:hypothetical protein
MERKIRIYHWWPGREYKKDNPIPPWLLREAERMGSRYLTVATEERNDRLLLVYGWAFCCPRDTPSRSIGRKIAMGRLLAWHG